MGKRGIFDVIPEYPAVLKILCLAMSLRKLAMYSRCLASWYNRPASVIMTVSCPAPKFVRKIPRTQDGVKETSLLK
jgi:hypothetical protein